MDITNNIQDKNFLFLKKYCELFPQEANKFVVLKETSSGTRYIEYAFKQGRPHDFTCLSWYDKPHPNYAKEHNGWQPPIIRHKVNCIYTFEPITCDGKCEVGCPPIKCSYIDSGKRAGKKWRDWSYKYPVKCACWQLYDLVERDLNNMKKKYYSIFNRIMDARPLTPEILTSARWERTNIGIDRVNCSIDISEDGVEFMLVTFRLSNNHTNFDVYRKADNFRSSFKRAISVGEFNTLLEIVGLTKFQI